MRPDVLCIGSVLWDVIGRAPVPMERGMDVPGRITRLPGGVALNIAVALRRLGLRPALLSAVGRDAEGEALVAACDALGLGTGALHRPVALPTDRYMAVEGANGLIAAVADARTLEAAGDLILRPLSDGTFGTKATPWDGIAALDGNLTEGLLAEIAAMPAMARADLRVAPASPGKAERLAPLLTHPSATLYVNLREAGALTGADPSGSAEAAAALRARGAARIAVTDGAGPATVADAGGTVTLAPPEVRVARITGAGDTFMAAHIAAEARGERGEDALRAALRTAGAFVSGVDGA